MAFGTTLHNAVPSILVLPTNFVTRVRAVPSNQLAVAMSVCRTTRRAFARPRCVFVLPISKSRIMDLQGLPVVLLSVDWHLPIRTVVQP